MKLRLKKGIVFSLILAALVIAGAAFFVHINGGGNLIIKDSASGKIYGRWPLEESGEFAIEFIHSVNQSPVREFYRIEDGKIRPWAVRFYGFGAGIQSDLEEGLTLSRDGDAMVISGFKASYKELNSIVGTVSDHLLFINGECISLRNLCGRSAHIIIYFK